MKILAADIGTTHFKMTLYDVAGDALVATGHYSQACQVHSYNNGLYADIDPIQWRDAFALGCASLQHGMSLVDVIAISGTTPGLSAMDKAGEALLPAILMMDQRSRSQARHIIDVVGERDLLAITGNMPVAGGCSLASMLWIREHQGELYRRTAVFGHSNTYLARWLTGRYALDPSSASLTSLYDTAKNDHVWNEVLLKSFNVSGSQLPDLLPSQASAGRVLPSLARRLGLHKEPPVLIGGNDAVLAAFAGNVEQPGDIMNVNGTCEITLVCLDRCMASTHYNIRTHILPGRWLTLHVMNAGGRALAWFKSVFCSEMTDAMFYESFLPSAIEEWLERDNGVTYVPFLMGSRYSLEPLTAEFKGLNDEAGRRQLMAALVAGLCEYQKRHLLDLNNKVA